MLFNAIKCKVLPIENSNHHFKYSMLDCQPSEVEEEKDLGVIISSDAKSAKQCQLSCAKANRMLGMIKRNIHYMSREVTVRLYKSLVWPLLEYCVQAWSPHYSKDKILIKRVQHRFTRMVPGLKFETYEEKLAILKLWSLEERRNGADLLELFKIYKGM